MAIISMAIKITRKGQITIPLKIRELLGSDVIEFKIINGRVVVEPVVSVAGSLSSYAKGYVPLEKAREAAWEKVVEDRSAE